MPSPHLFITHPTQQQRIELGDSVELWAWNLLDLNPDYTGWGVERGGTGYLREKIQHGEYTMDSSRIFGSWKEFVDDCEFGDLINNFEPDEYNEIVHFYFALEQETATSPITCSLMLWVLHPRHGAGVAIRIEEVRSDDLDAILSCLGAAAVRNVARFGPLLRLVAIPVSSAPGSRAARTTVPDLNVEHPRR